MYIQGHNLETRGAQGNTSPIYNRSNMVEDSATTEGNFGNVTNICYRNKDHSTNAFVRCVVILLETCLQHRKLHQDCGRVRSEAHSIWPGYHQSGTRV